VTGWLDVPRGWFDAFGEIARFGTRVMGLVYSGRVMKFFGESLRQAGILVLGSALIIWAFVFILGLNCGIIGAYFVRSQGAPALSGVFSAYCDLREGLPYAFGYILSAKVGTGIVAEIGAMRISEEIDALEVMGIQPVTFLAATRLLGAWIALPVIYLVGVGIVYFASYLAVVEQIGDVSSGGYLLIFWTFQDFLDVIFSLTKGMVMATIIVLVGCYYGYSASGGTGRSRDRHRQIDGGQHHHGPHRRHARHADLLRSQPASADRRLSLTSHHSWFEQSGLWQHRAMATLAIPRSRRGLPSIPAGSGTVPPSARASSAATSSVGELRPELGRSGRGDEPPPRPGDLLGHGHRVASTHSDGGITAADFELAAKIDAL
jgi:phospholipid/cholesterol/gamma-HCH transport system permease protein